MRGISGTMSWFQPPIANVPRGNQQQLRRLSGQQMGIDEIAIFCHEHSLLAIGVVRNVMVGRSVTKVQVQSMARVKTGGSEPVDHPERQLGVDEKIHGPSGCNPFVCVSRAA